MAPLIAATMTTLIFGRYLFEVFSFHKNLKNSNKSVKK